ncbi:hypothetical protein [Paenibacillus crassostreae]|uniref:CbiN domain protein n=1 Tax=Paenibacillus crassostreae TaxID=1763538 RepID=A0A167BVC8_9BACL|nr:hypothetical protein [Paenibacillus crassostreae]AOZ92534.1 hypothetical protein LPB68_10000 [Paenibacillus crassostreae]OAB72482.1 hypothetical protein PNBC_16445 [Paenibacillus crassostreae]
MKKAIIFMVVSILFVLMVNPTTTHALSCAEMPTGEQGYAEYDGIIIGHVEDVTREKDDNIIKLKVIQSFKKIDKEHLSVKENITWGSLHGPSEIGEEYLFYLRESDSGWENPLCSPTMKVADAGAELLFLQDKEVPVTRISAPTESTLEDNQLGESLPAILIGVCVAGVVVYGIWRLWRSRI